MSTLIKNKTVFCLLIITLFTTFFFARSVVVRERWIVPTFLHVYSQLEHKQHITAMNLGYVNNWLKEGPFHLHLGRYMYPASVEMPTLDQRNFHPSYPPGAITQLYLLFKMLDITGLVPDIYEQRGIQLLLVIFCNYMLHFLLALVMCCLAFFVCHKLGFDKLNSTLLAIVPAIVLFHNAGNLYWFHFVYAAPVVVVPLFALYIFLELLRLEHTSPRILRTVQIMQPSLMFIGVFTSWLFVFVVLTVYVMRIVRREITLPVSLQNTMRYAKQSFLFFLPSLVAIGIWMYSIVFYQRYVASANILKFPLSSLGFTFSNNLLIKMGILTHGGQVSGIDDFIYNFKYALYIYTNQDYGLIGVLMLYTVFYLAIRCRKFMAMQACTVSPAVITYLMLFIPSLIYTLFLVGDDAGHHFAAQKYSPALSVSFVFAPIFILQMLKKNHLMPAVHLLNGKALTIVALVGLGSSIVYGYAQTYNKQPITKMFSPPAYHHIEVGNFVRKNTEHKDVVFSKDYYLSGRSFLIESHFANKIIHFANNLDHIYHKVKSIKDDFTVKIFYYDKNQEEIEKLIIFLKSHSITVGGKQEEKIAGLLSFNGKKFLAWYEQTHACDDSPQRCEVSLQ